MNTKNKLILSLIILCTFILVSTISHADLYDAWNEQQGYWQLDNNLTDFYGNSTNNLDDSGTPSGYAFSSGAIGNAINFDGSTGYTKGDSVLNPNEVGTIEWLFKRDSASTLNLHHFNIVDSTTTRGFQQTTASSEVRLVFTDASCTSYSNGEYWDENWHHFVLINNSGGVKAYIDGNKVIDDSTCKFITSSQDDIILGKSYNTAGSYSFGLIDNLFITDYVYTPDDVNTSFNNSYYTNFRAFSSVDSDTLELNTIDNLLNSSHIQVFDNKLEFNFTTSLDVGTLCNFTRINLSDDSELSVYNASLTSSQLLINDTFILDSTQETFKYIMNCEGEESNFLIYTIDNVIPKISFDSPTISNNSKIYENPYFNVTFTDKYIFRTLINVTNSTGHTIFLDDSINLSGLQTSYFNSTTLNLEDFNNQEYKIRLDVADTHTDKSIKDYLIEKDLTKKELLFNTGNNNILVTIQKITEIKKNKDQSLKTKLNKIDVSKSFDRYSWTYDLNSDSDKEIVLRIGCSNNLHYLNDSNYQGHFICMDSPNSGNWLDLVSDSTITNIEKINNYFYDVTLLTSETLLEFNSIGGLNNENETIYFNFSSYNVTLYPKQLITDSSITKFNVTIDTTLYKSSTTNLPISLRKGNYNLTLSKGGYFDKNFSIIVDSDKNINLTGFYNSLINITAYDTSNNLTISNFTSIISNSDYSYSASLISDFGSISAPLIQGVVFDFSVSSTGYDTFSTSRLINNQYQNISIGLTPVTPVPPVSTADSIGGLQSTFYTFFFTLIWIVFIILFLTLKGFNGKPIGYFMVLQLFFGIWSALTLMQISIILGLPVLMVSLGMLVSWSSYEK